MRVIESHLTTVNITPGRHGRQPRAIVIHIMDGWFDGTIAHFRNPASRASAHILVGRDGRLGRCVNDADSAWANGLLSRPNIAVPLIAEWVRSATSWPHGVGQPNAETLSIEHEGRAGEQPTEAQLVASAWIAATWCHQYGIPADEDHLLGHYEIDSVTRGRCPSWTRATWLRYIAVVRAELEQLSAPPAPTGILTVNDPVLRPPSAPPEQAMLALVQRGGSRWYSDAVLWEWVSRYYAIANLGGLDPVIAIAQMVLETSIDGRPLSSPWASWTHRNPAGIGVTGHNDAQNAVAWPSIHTAVVGHVGRLLAYAVAAGAETDAQRISIQEALSARPLPPEYRGSAPTPAGLDGRWATRPGYAASIIRIANEILATAPTP